MCINTPQPLESLHDCFDCWVCGNLARYIGMIYDDDTGLQLVCRTCSNEMKRLTKLGTTYQFGVECPDWLAPIRWVKQMREARGAKDVLDFGKEA